VWNFCCIAVRGDVADDAAADDDVDDDVDGGCVIVVAVDGVADRRNWSKLSAGILNFTAVDDVDAGDVATLTPSTSIPPIAMGAPSGCASSPSES
jgi:hypothetical protein